MKRFGLHRILFLAVIFFFNACASHDEVMTNQSGASVPGEKVGGAGGVEPGMAPGGAAANVHW